MTTRPEHDAPKLHPHPVYELAEPQMSGGERAALEGVLSALQPRLAIEIGTAEGATLGMIAAHAAEVHSFDLFEPVLESGALPNVTLHTGDSHALLPAFLDELAAAGRNVDFVLVDGDHSSDGVRRDIEDLLDSPALANTTILAHDASYPTVRAGLEAVDYAARTKVAEVDLDWVAGYIFTNAHFANELWGGLAWIVVDATRPADAGPPEQQRYVPLQAPLLEQARRASGAPGGAAPAAGAAADGEASARLLAAERAAREQLARGDAARWPRALVTASRNQRGSGFHHRGHYEAREFRLPDRTISRPQWPSENKPR